MKDLVNKIISNLHIILFLYGAWGAWGLYDEHNIQLEEIVNRGSGLDEEIRKTKAKVREIQEFTKKTDEYKVRVEEVAKNIETVQRQLPAETNDTQILTFLQNEMNALKIQDAQFTPGREDKSTYYISKEYKFKAKGTFLQFLIFFERVGSADRIYNVKDIKLAKNSDAQRGRFQIINVEGTLQAFRFNPEFKVERGF